MSKAKGLFILIAIMMVSPVKIHAADSLDQAKFRRWTQAMKKSAKGPFEKILWFCKDGTRLPPKPYACSGHGGGIQHGLWNRQTLALRDAGFQVGNVLAELRPKRFIGPDADLKGLKQILLERFLIAADDGWIFRGARSYRGALQSEDEEASAERIVRAMLRDPLWLTPPRFALLREAVRLLPQKNSSPAVSEVRQLSTKIHKNDPNFAALRARIHAFPSRDAANLVRDYARIRGLKALQADYRRLAKVIDQVFSDRNLFVELKSVISKMRNPALKKSFKSARNKLKASKAPEERLLFASQLMAEMRDAMPKAGSVLLRLRLLRVSLVLEKEVFRVSSILMKSLAKTSRRQQLLWLNGVARSLYGIGFLHRRHLQGMDDSLDRLFANVEPSVYDYRKEIRYLEQAIGWSDRTWAFLFKESLNQFLVLEPLVGLYSQDRMRGSPLLFLGSLIDNLTMDANRLANMEHSLFGRSKGAGVRALNPGLARGVLHMARSGEATRDLHGIYLLEETTSDLTPVAGILTRGAGNALSHVQLLARNLGIPNAVIGAQWLPEVTHRVGSRIVMSVTKEGVVTLAEDSPEWDRLFIRKKQSKPSDMLIRPDLDKLNLEEQNFISLTNLRAGDSGRIAGPKGANLGELKYRFGDVVPSGFVIPFGVFRKFLDKPLVEGGPTVFSWMQDAYVQIAALPPETKIRQKKVQDFLSRLRQWIVRSDPGVAFRKKLKSALRQHFGGGKKGGAFGVFVRSDTNVEDLPGFTGAGLNLTVPNVVGYSSILRAIQQVWASPFTERAFAWRQAHMDQPQFVFPAVLVQYSFPSEKSGVMVTKDVLWGEPEWLSIAVNEGVGGAVDGQSAESLRVHPGSGEVRFLAHATASYKRQLSRNGGLKQVAASGSDRVLEEDEIRQLIQFAQKIPEKFPSLRDASSGLMAVDVEFAFRNGQLALLQIRPFVEAKGARRLGFVPKSGVSKFKWDDRTVPLDVIPDFLNRASGS